VVVDASRDEVYVAEARNVHVFNAFGMEVHAFRTGEDLGPIRDLAVLPDGSLLVLAYDPTAPPDAPRFVLSRRDYRGAPTGLLVPTGVPESLASFRPNRLFLQRDRLLLLSTHKGLGAVLALDGAYERTLDLRAALGIAGEEADDVQISGAGIDEDGDLLLSIAVLFRVFVVSPDGELRATWGKSGSGAGAFGNVGGIDADAQGRVYVVDRIRKSVLVFDRESRAFLGEFGGDPRLKGSLGMPSDIALDGHGRAYVTQVGRAGVSVFAVE
jgi:hypothetical protein